MTAIETTIKETKELTEALEQEDRRYIKVVNKIFMSQIVLEATMIVLIVVGIFIITL